MKKILTLALIVSTTLASATTENPLPSVKSNLENILSPIAGRKSFPELKENANEKNLDIDVAFDNYLIAKRNVAVARARFNPITTGHLLGMSLGITFLWAPIAIEGVLSIPTKIYNVAKNKHLERAALYNFYQSRNVLNNELAHLYYDILTHEALLETIDQEIQVLNYQQERRASTSATPDLESQKYILKLSMQRVDIYDMYIAEMAEIKTLSATTDASQFKLAQVPVSLNKSITDNIDLTRLQSFSVTNSNLYKSASEFTLASHSNVRQVQWSILSWSGLNFSYGRRIKSAKTEEVIANTKEDSTQIQLKNGSLIQLQKLNSSIGLDTDFNSLSRDSIDLFEDTYQSYLIGQANEDAAIEASLGAIRDFRNTIVAHYGAWSSFNDFATAINVDLKSNADGESKTIEEQLESLSSFKANASEFQIVATHNNDSIDLRVKSQKIGDISKVTYVFAEEKFPTTSSDDGSYNYGVSIQEVDSVEALIGKPAVAIIKLDDGQTVNVNFKL